MSDPVMESLEILGTPEFSNLWRVEGDEGENDEKVVKDDDKRWKMMNNDEKQWKGMKNNEKVMKNNKK